MSRDVIMVGSTMRILMLYRGEYSQWHERFLNYLEEKTNGEAMIHSITHGEQPLLVVAQVSLAGTTPNAPPTLKDPKFWTAEEKKDRKIDLLIRDFEYGKQDREAAILYEYETFKALEGEQLLDTYLRYLQVINDLKKCGYKKDNCVLNYKQNQGGVNDAMGYKKKAVVVTLDSLALVDEKTKVNKSKEKVVVQSDSDGSDDEDINDLKNNTALLAKDFNRKKYYAKPMNNNLRTTSASTSANKKPKYVNSEEKKDDGKKRDLSKVKCYNCKDKNDILHRLPERKCQRTTTVTPHDWACIQKYQCLDLCICCNVWVRYYLCLYVFICVYVGYVRFGNQSIERDHLIGIGFVLDFVELISFTFGDKEMIS
ncbi:hypothetical protein Tco_0315688 [Tanacetum coccineum]